MYTKERALPPPVCVWAVRHGAIQTDGRQRWPRRPCGERRPWILRAYCPVGGCERTRSTADWSEGRGLGPRRLPRPAREQRIRNRYIYIYILYIGIYTGIIRYIATIIIITLVYIYIHIHEVGTYSTNFFYFSFPRILPTGRRRKYYYYYYHCFYYIIPI